MKTRLFYEIGEKKIVILIPICYENCCHCPVSAVFLGWEVPDDSEMRENVHNPATPLFWKRNLPDLQKREISGGLSCFVTNINDHCVICFFFSELSVPINFCRSKI